ncbi:MAG: SPOR domain-containing protein [Candidatus Margulisiibacteriota bacterium]
METEETKIGVPPKRKSGFAGLIKNLLLLLLLAGVIVASFWISFHLGKRILVPVKKIPERRIEVAIPEPPPSIAAMQRLEEVMIEELEKEEPAEVVVAKPKPKPKAGAIHYYKVQAGVFSEKNNAIGFAKKLRASGFETYIKKVSKGWRVQAGAFFKKAQALHLQNSLNAKGFKSVIVFE